VSSEVQQHNGGFEGGIGLFVLDEVLVFLVRGCVQKLPSSLRSALGRGVVARIGGAGACAIGSLGNRRANREVDEPADQAPNRHPDRDQRRRAQGFATRSSRWRRAAV